jgi:hypothetical protein
LSRQDEPRSPPHEMNCNSDKQKLMQYSRNQNASALLTVKHGVLAMLQTTQARANLITESA